MAKIISVSLSEKLLEEIDQLKDETGFSGRGSARPGRPGEKTASRWARTW